MANVIKLDDPIIQQTADRVVGVELVGDTWTDDHLLCFQTKVTLDDDTTELVEFWWMGEDGYAAVKYCDESPSALSYVKKMMRDRFETAVDCLNDFNACREEYPNHEDTLDKIEVNVLKLMKLI